MTGLQRLVRKIHERSIWQLLAVYVGGATALLGHVDLLTARFGLPDWLFSASVVLIAAGLVGVMTVRIWPTVWRPDVTGPARHTAQMGVLYFLGAWLLLEVLAIYSEEGHLALPAEIIFPVLPLMLLLLFPITGVWAFLSARRHSDATLKRIRRVATVGLIGLLAALFLALYAIEAASGRSRVGLLVFGFVCLVFVLALTWYWFRRGQGGPEPG